MLTETRAVLTDIEGTTSSIAFVTDTLFPYAKTHLARFVKEHPAETEALIEDVRAIAPGDPVETLLRWIDEDRKETPLKTLQGLIWAKGYADGVLKGHVYPDAVDALRRWHEDGIELHIYSSGSIAAQKLIFGHSDAGDLTPLFSGYFDTTTGPKKEAASYMRIAERIGLPIEQILFLSDSAAEIEAARTAGMQVQLIDREAGQGDISNFSEVLL